MEKTFDFLSVEGGMPSRRKFIGTLAATAGLSSLSGISFADSISKEKEKAVGDAAKWIDKIKGSHRVVYDVTKPHDILPFAWPRVFLLTNEMTGSPASDCGVLVVLRHDAIPFAMETALWEKYKFGEVFNYMDPVTQMPSTRNPFWMPGMNDFQVPGIGVVDIGINQLQESGVMLCVCDMAITVYSAAIAQKMEANPEAVKSDFHKGVLPGIQIVPSGVWALGRAQEKGCGYIYV